MYTPPAVVHSMCRLHLLPSPCPSGRTPHSPPSPTITLASPRGFSVSYTCTHLASLVLALDDPGLGLADLAQDLLLHLAVVHEVVVAEATGAESEADGEEVWTLEAAMHVMYPFRVA